MPWRSEPMPAEPPAMKPPIVAISWVEGKIGSSAPVARSAALSAPILQPAATRTIPGPISAIWSRPSVSMIMPPSSGTAWP